MTKDPSTYTSWYLCSNERAGVFYKGFDGACTGYLMLLYYLIVCDHIKASTASEMCTRGTWCTRLFWKPKTEDRCHRMSWIQCWLVCTSNSAVLAYNAHRLQSVHRRRRCAKQRPRRTRCCCERRRSGARCWGWARTTARSSPGCSRCAAGWTGTPRRPRRPRRSGRTPTRWPPLCAAPSATTPSRPSSPPRCPRISLHT